MKHSGKIVIALAALSLLITLFFYDSMPENLAIHWNIAGNADGFGPKGIFAFVLPALAFIVPILMLFIPRLDPLRANIEKFRTSYDLFCIAITAFLVYINAISIYYNLGNAFSFTQFMAPAFGVLIFATGHMVGVAERNWFIGIRTPWTLSSEKVWKKTHKLGGKLFKAAGVITLIAIVLPAYGIFFVIVPVLVFTVYALVYSYQEYQKETSAKGKRSVRAASNTKAQVRSKRKKK